VIACIELGIGSLVVMLRLVDIATYYNMKTTLMRYKSTSVFEHEFHRGVT